MLLCVVCLFVLCTHEESPHAQFSTASSQAVNLTGVTVQSGMWRRLVMYVIIGCFVMVEELQDSTQLQPDENLCQ